MKAADKNLRKKLIDVLRDTERGASGKESNVYIEKYGPDSTEEEYLEYYRSIDREKLLKYEYEKFFGEDEEYRMVRAYLFFPNYGFMVKALSDSNSITESIIKAELWRMKSDGLITIEPQTIQEYTYEEDGGFNRILGKGWTSKTEGLILTTRGKSVWKYYWSEAVRNPLSWIAILISLVSLVIALFK